MGSVTFVVQRERVLVEIDDRLKTQVDSLRTVADTGQPPKDAAANGTKTATEQLDPAAYTSVDEYLNAVVARLVPGHNEASLAIIDGHARYRPQTLSGFDISGDKDFIDRIVAETAGSADPVSGTATTPQGSLRYIAIPVSMAGDPQKGVYVRAVDLGAELGPVTTSIITYAIAAGIVLLSILVVGWFVAGRLLSPLQKLRDTADAITIDDLGARLPAAGNDDISDLTRTVNSMLDRLEGSVDVQRQLLDDVRHELKTPITIVRGHLEMMDASDTADVESAREIGMAELDRMTRLVEDIDLLAAAEGDQFSMTDIDVDALTDRVGELVAVIPGHDWVVTTRGHGVIVGDADRLIQAWLQLADNAAKYTSEGSPIEIGSAADDAEARLWVSDHGPGIPPAERRRIFRRFDRAQVKRSVGGSGLGLAIVEAITKAHGGHCSVGDAPGGGAVFTIHVPLGTAPAVLPAPVRAGDVVLQREAAG
ncbi:ATP-binding protein [Microbacterium sp. CJ88]|uniref:sensor histidine kinase n=1 Tax=Microbacterium sp. CJ88 TaxID=3445672 RepID=UPI003F65972C